MKRKTLPALIVLIASALFAWAFGCSMGGDEVPRMSADELKSRLVDPSVTVIDVRQPQDWEGSSAKIKGAVREDPGKVSAWISNYQKDGTLVFYCA